MNILSARFALLAGSLALTAGACSRQPPPAVELRERIEVAGAPPVDARISIQPEHRRLQERYIAAVKSTLKQNRGWLGPLPAPSLTLIDPAWRGTVDGRAEAIVLDRTPWWSAATSMTPELSVARALSRRLWTDAIPAADLPSWFIPAFTEYSARRAVVPLFERENLSPGYAFLELRFFGGFVPRFARVRLLVETDGDPLPAYRARPTVDPRRPAQSELDARALEAKAILALGTLECWVGRPVFDQLVAQFVRESRAGRPGLADFARIASDVSGQDLTWFFDEAFGSSNLFDYGVAGLESKAAAAGIFETTVTVRRYGSARFTGTSATPVGPFEAGRGVALLVTFADGQQRTDYWDGRASDRVFHYRSPSRAVSAVVDPERTMLLDLHRANNSRTLAPRTVAAASLWTTRYIFWLEDLLLTWAALS